MSLAIQIPEVSNRIQADLLADQDSDEHTKVGRCLIQRLADRHLARTVPNTHTGLDRIRRRA